MAFAISMQQTVLWDQIRYSGDPSEFAWVLPVRAGARIELSRDEWFAALDASTQPVVTYSYGGGAGCSLAGCSSAANSGAAGSASVQVLAQQVVGPYETVTLRSTDPSALTNWLASHAFAVPASIQPLIDQYVAEGFDFIALRLRPQCGEQSMQPVRVVAPGADPTLPLRMVAAGVGARVGVILYVLGQGRWRPQNFAEVLFDDSKLTWDTTLATSNYESLAESLMASNDGKSFLTEAALQPDLTGWVPQRPDLSTPSPYGSYGSSNPGLASSYFALCRGVGQVSGAGSVVAAPPPCGQDAGQDAGATSESGADGGGLREAGGDEASLAPDADASGADAEDAGAFDGARSLDASDDGADAGASGDGAEPPDARGASDEGGLASADGAPAVDGGQEDGPNSSNPLAAPDPCTGFDDLDVAFGGLDPNSLWVTRLRADLPADALAVDLRLEAAPVQEPVSNAHVVPPQAAVQSRQGCVSATHTGDAVSTSALFAATALGIGAIRRRYQASRSRRRRRR
jgi:hypothetical protein